MNAVDRELQAIIESEADHVRPPAGAKELGWARLMAALPGEGGPEGGGGPDGAAAPPVRPVASLSAVPPLKAAPTLKVVPLLKALPLAALLVVGAVVAWGMGDDPAIVADSLPPAPEPALSFNPPIYVPFAPERSAAPPTPAPEAPATTDTPDTPDLPAPARPTPRPAPQEDDFAGELKLLAAGQAAIQRGALREGLALLRSHRQRFPRGHFAQERDALIAIARCESGQAAAPAAGQKFLQDNPESIHAERVRSACKL